MFQGLDFTGLFVILLVPAIVLFLIYFYVLARLECAKQESIQKHVARRRVELLHVRNDESRRKSMLQ